MLLGSGTSRDAGGRTMTELWSDFASTNATEKEFLISARYIDETGTPNVEDVLSTLNGDLASQRRRNKVDPTLLNARNALYRAVIAASVLQSDLWRDPVRSLNHPALAAHQQLISKLIGIREVRQAAPAVFTTNYDLAVEWAADSLDIRYYNGFDGVHLRQFAPQKFDLQLYNASARGSARFGVYGFTLIKLHGSLTWRYAAARAVESPTPLAFDELEDFLNAKTDELADRLMIFPSSGKYADTTQYMYGEMLRRFSDFLSTTQTCLLVCGYSFRDDHINRLIETGLNTPNLQLVIYLPDATVEETGKTETSEKAQAIARRAGPRCTLIGNGERAHFQEMVKDLPGSPQGLDLISAEKEDAG